jgi:hypothetical protein
MQRGLSEKATENRTSVLGLNFEFCILTAAWFWWGWQEENLKVGVHENHAVQHATWVPPQHALLPLKAKDHFHLWSLGFIKITFRTSAVCGPGSSVGIATGYGLDGPGIEFRWGQDFSHTSRPALGPTQPPVQWVPGISWGKSAGAWCWPPTPPIAEVENG